MSKKRTQYSSEFKAKVALAAIRGDETIPQLAARYGLHPTQINSWKRQLIEQAAELFSRNNSAGKERTNHRRFTSSHRATDGRTRFFSQKARSLSAAERKMMIELNDKPSRVRQCRLLSLARSTYYSLSDIWDQQFHFMDYMMYDYLQTGETEKARGILQELQAIKKAEPENTTTAYAFAATPARYAIERGEWREASELNVNPIDFPWKQFAWCEAITHFARGLGAARNGKMDVAKTSLKRLEILRDKHHCDDWVCGLMKLRIPSVPHPAVSIQAATRLAIP